MSKPTTEQAVSAATDDAAAEQTAATDEAAVEQAAASDAAAEAIAAELDAALEPGELHVLRLNLDALAEHLKLDADTAATLEVVQVGVRWTDRYDVRVGKFVRVEELAAAGR